MYIAMGNHKNTQTRELCQWHMCIRIYGAHTHLHVFVRYRIYTVLYNYKGNELNNEQSEYTFDDISVIRSSNTFASLPKIIVACGT